MPRMLDDLQTCPDATPDGGNPEHSADGFCDPASTADDLSLVGFSDNEANQYATVLTDALSHPNCVPVFDNAHGDKLYKLLHDHVPTAISGALFMPTG